MKSQVIEISGYRGAFTALYMTKKNCTPERLADIEEALLAVDNRGFLIEDSPYKEKFFGYMNSIIKYGIREEHETLLDYIDITTITFGLHRGAQDDWDAHAKRMVIIRTSSRYGEFEKSAEISDWYKGKIIPFYEMERVDGIKLPDIILVDNYTYRKLAWGYVREDLVSDGDVRRGLVDLAVASDNTTKMSYRNWRHVYNLRRAGTHASPELQEKVEIDRKELQIKMPPLGDNLGKIWVPKTGFVERPNVVYKVDYEEET
jgi:hypothetical protein